MGYDSALSKSWEELKRLSPDKSLSVKFLADEYSVDTIEAKVISLSCNTLAKDFYAILILHYLAAKLKGLPKLTGNWLTFRELSGVEGYEAAFRKRALEPLIRKYGRKAGGADSVIELQAFEGVPALVKIWKADDEFGPEANILFDASIKEIFCTEDIAVLAQIIGVSL